MVTSQAVVITADVFVISFLCLKCPIFLTRIFPSLFRLRHSRGNGGILCIVVSLLQCGSMLECPLPFAGTFSWTRTTFQSRVEQFRKKVKGMSNEELVTLSVLLRAGTLDLTEEMRVPLQETIRERATQRRRNPNN